MIGFRNYINTFNPISEKTWEQLSILFIEKRLSKGEYFIQENQIAKQIAFLKDGIVRSFFRNANGKEYNKHFFQSPSFFGGYSSLISGTASKINEQALTDCIILVADFNKFNLLLEKCFDLEFFARKTAEFFFVEKELREIELVLLDAEERYALMQKRFPHLEQYITQYHIASYLGVSPTQLSRIRKKNTR